MWSVSCAHLHHFLVNVDVVVHCLLTRVVEWWMLLVGTKNNAQHRVLVKTKLSRHSKIEHGKTLMHVSAENELVGSAPHHDMVSKI